MRGRARQDLRAEKRKAGKRESENGDLTAENAKNAEKKRHKGEKV
jgi:hypothetical protein